MTELIPQPREVPKDFLKDPEFSEFFYARAARFKEEMEETYIKIREKSRIELRADYLPGNEDFDVWVCPIKAMFGNKPNHPFLLTYCSSSRTRAQLYWPEDMLTLSNEERRDIWYEFVKDDDWYFQFPENYYCP